MDKEIIITFPPKSILFPIEVSPKSLQILTENSVKIAIPVIFNKIKINWVLIFVLLPKFFTKLITSYNSLTTNVKIITPTY